MIDWLNVYKPSENAAFILLQLFVNNGIYSILLNIKSTAQGGQCARSTSVLFSSLSLISFWMRMTLNGQHIEWPWMASTLLLVPVDLRQCLSMLADQGWNSCLLRGRVSDPSGRFQLARSTSRSFNADRYTMHAAVLRKICIVSSWPSSCTHYWTVATLISGYPFWFVLAVRNLVLCKK